jgi:glycosyltransferase involved in cell wall biosynthesis
MKVLFFLLFSNPFPGAGWTRTNFFAEYLAKNGNEVSIAGIFSLLSLKHAGVTSSNHIRIVNLMPVLRTENIFSVIVNLLSSIVASFGLFVVLRPNVVVISVPSGEICFGPYIVAKLFKAKKIAFDYRDEWEDFAISRTNSNLYKSLFKFLKHIMTKCYVNSDLVLTVNEALLHSLELRGIRNIKILTNGADSYIFKPYDKKMSRSKMGLSDNDFVIVYSGIIGGYYSLDLVLQGLKRLVSTIPNIRLLMVGYGPALQEIMGMAKELGLEDVVLYCGAKYDLVELAEILSAADIGIVPYDSDLKWVNLPRALPVKTFEYLACGLPVIAATFKDSLIAKLICENNVGLVSAPGNIDALVKNIEKMYYDEAFVKDVSKRAVILIEERYNRNKIAEEFLNLLKC